MKYYILASAFVVSHSFAMETQIHIVNRHLNTLEKPYITIINQLPVNDPHFPKTRIDISDQTKIKTYTHDSYRPDDSTKTIYPNNGIRFSPQTHKTLHEYKRLGMNDAANAAIVAMYIHGALKHRYLYLVIGKGTVVQFGDVLTFSKDNDNNIIIKHNDEPIIKFATIQKTAENCQLSQPMSEKTQSIFAKYSKPRTSAPVIRPLTLIGLPGSDCFKVLDIRSQVLEEALENNSYIKAIVIESLNQQ